MGRGVTLIGLAILAAGCRQLFGIDDTAVVAVDAARDAAADARPIPAACVDFCAEIQMNCTGTNLMFGSPATCMASCAAWQPGMIGEMAGNTLECRAYHAGAAAMDPMLHCTHAGPGGNAACGTNCEGYCTLVQAACIGGNLQYNDDAQCMAACMLFPTAPAYSANVMTGDSFACRLYHATAASTNPSTHCPHVRETSMTCQ